MSEVVFVGGPVDRVAFGAPVRSVVVLEDRAQVRRVGRVAVAAGLNRLVVEGVAPLLQDLSLRGEVVAGAARVADARVRRALRVSREKPTAVAALEGEIRGLVADQRRAAAAAGRAVAAHGRVGEIVAQGMRELPEDVAWGLGAPAQWAETFEALFARGRALVEEARGHAEAAEDAERALGAAVARRVAVDRPDQEVVAFVELDVVAEAAGEVELGVVYTVANALWRPVHRARLEGEVLRFECRAAVWQRSGEDWVDVELAVSTAQSGLGTEPPVLDEDRLAAQRREDRVVVAAREVEVAQAEVKGGAAVGAVELPGVDDGGETRHLVAPRRVTVPSDGRPRFVGLFAFEAPAVRDRVLLAELDAAVHLRVRARHSGRLPVLAGPVELVRDAGVAGWTETLFVAPGAVFELGFGPDDALRAVRRVESAVKVDSVDKWRRRRVKVAIFLSNLGGEARAVQVVERVPVAEVEEVRVAVIEKETDGAERPDADGMWVAERVVPAHGHLTVRLGWEVATAPGVTGM